MMETVVGQPASAGTRTTGIRWLVIALAFVLGFRLVLYMLMPDFGTDFDLLYHAAEHLVRGVNPYPIAAQWFLYPLFYPFLLSSWPFPLRCSRLTWRG